MGPGTPRNSGANFQEEIDRLFSPESEDEKTQDEAEDGDKKPE